MFKEFDLTKVRLNRHSEKTIADEVYEKLATAARDIEKPGCGHKATVTLTLVLETVKGEKDSNATMLNYAVAYQPPKQEQRSVFAALANGKLQVQDVRQLEFDNVTPINQGNKPAAEG